MQFVMECKPLSSDIKGNKILTVENWRYSLKVNMYGSCVFMRIPDFKKMITTVCNMTEPEQAADYLAIWDEFIQDHFDEIKHADKLLAFLEQRVNRLPSWVFEE